MGRRKRNSNILEQARARLNGLKSIDPALDFGNSLNVAAFEQVINSTHTKLDGYNQKLSELDEDLLDIETAEKMLDDLNGRFLAGVGARYGRNSIEYEKAGGIRTDDRKRPSSKKGPGSSSQS